MIFKNILVTPDLKSSAQALIFILFGATRNLLPKFLLEKPIFFSLNFFCYFSTFLTCYEVERCTEDFLWKMKFIVYVINLDTRLNHVKKTMSQSSFSILGLILVHSFNFITHMEVKISKGKGQDQNEHIFSTDKELRRSLARINYNPNFKFSWIVKYCVFMNLQEQEIL